MVINSRKFVLAITAIFLAAGFAFAQPESAANPFPSRNDRKPEESLPMREMLAKRQAENEKKEHEALLKRGQDALRLSEELERSFEQRSQITKQDLQKLEALEKVVSKIRNELGGDDDGETDESLDKTEKPSTLMEAFKFLKSSTTKLVSELQKTSRFSISAVAIQSSNSVIRLARFLRLRK